LAGDVFEPGRDRTGPVVAMVSDMSPASLTLVIRPVLIALLFRRGIPMTALAPLPAVP
jgi:hypothetical protein